MIELPIGSDSFDLANLRVGDSGPCEGVEERFCPQRKYFQELLSGYRNRSSLFADRGQFDRIYLLGGATWAISRLMHPEQVAEAYTRLSRADLAQAYAMVEQLEANMAAAVRSAQATGATAGRMMQSQGPQIARRYKDKPDSLKFAILILTWLHQDIVRDDGKPMFFLNRPGDLPKQYVALKQGHYDFASFPRYVPSIPVRSLDLER